MSPSIESFLPSAPRAGRSVFMADMGSHTLHTSSQQTHTSSARIQKKGEGGTLFQPRPLPGNEVSRQEPDIHGPCMMGRPYLVLKQPPSCSWPPPASASPEGVDMGRGNQRTGDKKGTQFTKKVHASCETPGAFHGRTEAFYSTAVLAPQHDTLAGHTTPHPHKIHPDTNPFPLPE